MPRCRSKMTVFQAHRNVTMYKTTDSTELKLYGSRGHHGIFKDANPCGPRHPELERPVAF